MAVDPSERSSIGKGASAQSQSDRIVEQVVVDRWSGEIDASYSDAVFWLANPIVQRRYQARAVGQTSSPHWVNYCVERFLPDLPVDRILSVGCGGGDLERHLASLGAARAIDGVDISPQRIQVAREGAKEAGYVNLRYFASNVETDPFPESRYDAVLFNASLHHMFDVDRILARVARALWPDGLLIVNEYVGPNRFDLSAREREVLKATWSLLPERYRRSCNPSNPGSLLESPALPNPVDVEKFDPSESVQSEEILPRIQERFELLDLKDLGGSLLHFLLANIAGNFRVGDTQAEEMLDVLFSLEDALVASGDLGTHFALAVARPRDPSSLSLDHSGLLPLEGPELRPSKSD